jgi:hypothetical protein
MMTGRKPERLRHWRHPLEFRGVPAGAWLLAAFLSLGLAAEPERLSQESAGESWTKINARFHPGQSDAGLTRTVCLQRQLVAGLPQRTQLYPKPFVWTADADLILGKIRPLSKRIDVSGH